MNLCNSLHLIKNNILLMKIMPGNKLNLSLASNDLLTLKCNECDIPILINEIKIPTLDLRYTNDNKLELISTKIPLLSNRPEYIPIGYLTQVNVEIYANLAKCFDAGIYNIPVLDIPVNLFDQTFYFEMQIYKFFKKQIDIEIETHKYNVLNNTISLKILELPNKEKYLQAHSLISYGNKVKILLLKKLALLNERNQARRLVPIKQQLNNKEEHSVLQSYMSCHYELGAIEKIYNAIVYETYLLASENFNSITSIQRLIKEIEKLEMLALSNIQKTNPKQAIIEHEQYKNCKKQIKYVFSNNSVNNNY